MPVLHLGLDISSLRSGAAQASASLDSVSRSAQNIERNTADLGRAFAAAARQVAALVGAYKALDSIKGFVQRGVEFNSSMEQSRIGIASIITATTQLTDAQGKLLEGAEKYAAAQTLSADLMAQIQRLSLETTATTEQLVQGFQSVMGSALNVGFELEQIPRFAVAGAQAMQALGIPLEQMRTELDALLTGNINRVQDLLAPRLGLDGETIRKWREQGVLFERIMERLSAFERAGQDVAQTWRGLVSNFSEAMDVLAGQTSSNLSESLKDSVRLLQDMILVTDGGAPRISDNFQQIADTLQGMEAALGESILSITQDFVEAVKSLNASIADMGGSEALFGRMETAISTVGAALASVAVLRRSGAVAAINASQQQTAAMVTEQRAVQALAQTERDAAQAARNLAAQENQTAQAAVANARSQLQAVQSQRQALQAREQNAYTSQRLRNALVQEAAARQALNQAQRDARSTSAALTAADSVLVQAEQRLATVTQQVATATSVRARSLATAQGIWTTASTAITAAAGRLATGLRALYAGLGGGVGLAITALITGLTYLTTRQDDAAKAADLHAQAQRNLDAVTKELETNTGKLNTQLTATQKIKLMDTQTDALKAYNLQVATLRQSLKDLLDQQRQANEATAAAGGISLVSEDMLRRVEDLLDLLSQGPEHALEAQEALSQLRLEMQQAGLGSSRLGQELETLSKQTDQHGQSFVDYASTVNSAKQALQSLAGAIATTTNAMASGIAGLDEVLKRSEISKLLSSQNASTRAGLSALQGVLNQKQLEAVARGDLSGFSKEDSTKIQQIMANSRVRVVSSGGGSRSGGGGGASAIASAQRSIAELRREMALMRGEATQASNELSTKFEEIARTGKQAGMSAGQIAALQKEYQEAFQVETLRDFDKELLQVQGNTKALRDIEIAEKMQEWKAQLEGAGLSAEEAAPKLAQMREALEGQQKIQDLQSAISFYKELGELSGEYGQSIALQNELIMAEGEAYRKAGISEELVKQWELLKQIENARDPFSGIARSTQQYFSQATDYATKMGDIWTDTMDGMADALTEFVLTGKLDFQDLANEFIKQVIRMQMQAMVSGLFKGIGGIFTGFFGGDSISSLGSTAGGGAAGGSSSGLIAAIAGSAKGNVFVGGSLGSFSGSIVDSPTLFTSGRHIPAYASGIGLMGEAGPEAIMPLSRMSNGKLGVQADLSGSAGANGVNVPINIEVYNETGANSTVETQQRRNSEGGLDIEMYIKRVVAQDIAKGNGGMIAGTMQSTYGLKRQQRGR